jgi:hypothetical protein
MSHTAIFNHFKKQSVLCFCLILGIFLLGWIIQSHLLINHDVAWLLEASKRLLGGGNYSHDFFENNPPMILYLYLPPVLFSKFLSINLILTFRVYMLLLAGLSLYFCDLFCKKIFHEQDNLIKNSFEITLAVIFLVTPLYEFGQREHILLMFTMPYFLAIVCQLQEYPIKKSQAAIVGVMAGFGFALKPYFLLPFIFIELYYMFCKKNLFSWQRTECLVVVGILALYPIVVFIFNRDYYTVIVPYAWHWCYLAARYPWKFILIQAPILFCAFIILFYLMQHNTNPYKKLGHVLIIALIGFLTSYIAQHLYYEYHLLPAYSVALLILVFLFSLQLSKPSSSAIKLSLLTIMPAALLGAYFFFYGWSLFNYFILISNPTLYLEYTAGIFALLLFLTSRNKSHYFFLKIVAITLLIILVSYFFNKILIGSSYHFVLLTTFLFMLLGYFVLKLSENGWQTMQLAILATMIFAFPACYFYISYSNSENSIQQKMPGLASFIKTHALHKSIYYLTTDSDLMVSSFYEDTKYVSRFSFFWMLGALVSKPYFHLDSDPKQSNQDMNFLINMVADDINKEKPDFVLVDKSTYKKYLFFLTKSTDGAKQVRVPIPFDYVVRFSKNDNFNKAWKPYIYLQTITIKFYPYDVYQRT